MGAAKAGAVNLMNYHPIMAEAVALGVADVTGFLREELPRRWMTDYKEATPRPTNILSIELGTFFYMFDFVTELETEGVLEPGPIREDRLVAGYGFSTAQVGGRDAGQMRGWVGPTEKYLGAGRDKGHVFGRAIGGRVDGLEINLFSGASIEPGLVRRRQIVPQNGAALRHTPRNILLL